MAKTVKPQKGKDLKPKKITPEEKESLSNVIPNLTNEQLSVRQDAIGQKRKISGPQDLEEEGSQEEIKFEDKIDFPFTDCTFMDDDVFDNKLAPKE